MRSKDGYQQTTEWHYRKPRPKPYRSRVERIPDVPYMLPKRVNDALAIVALALVCALFEASWRASAIAQSIVQSAP